MLQAARRHGVDPRALWAIAYMETRFRPNLVSAKGARGMMQFMPATAARFGLLNSHDSVAAIDAAARYVRVLSQRFAGSSALVLAAYNAGEGAVESYLRGVPLRLPGGKVINPRGQRTGGVPPYAETKRYVTGGLSVMHLVSNLGVFTAPQIAACGVPLALPIQPRRNGIAYLSRGTENSPTGKTEARAASVEDVMETIPEPMSIYAAGLNRIVGAPLPPGEVLTLEKAPPGKSESDSIADADRLKLPTSSYSFGNPNARKP
ncbi:MAG: lytic transglycosylase domain-containing protein [Pyrinomonadaceae bacterium MAG19_C2-C3]|nr:lytic transglycosylase domain-containing protein [Pyrinomonadaceae bacterium MAG19_C2-C3]